MASLYKKEDSWVIEFYDGNGKRPKIRLGKMTKKAAETITSHVETIISCRLAGQSAFPSETSAWLGKLPDDTLLKLDKAGLVSFQRYTLGELWETFRKQKKGVKQSTLVVYDYVEHRLFSYFDRTTYLRRLSSEHFENWKTFLKTDYRSPRDNEPLSEATVAGSITKVKAVFNWAIKEKWITKDQDPLQGVGRGSFASRVEFREMTMDDYRLLLAFCPCQEWRVIIALARIGALRPGEILLLRWADIDWEKKRVRVTSPKTEHHEGKESRIVPLFWELRVELERLFQDAFSEGKEFVINRYRPGQNMVKPFSDIVKKAGLEPFLRPFDSMREIRATEIYYEYGAINESRWVGHSKKIAEKCYVKTLDSHIEHAARQPDETVQVERLIAPFQESEIPLAQNPGRQASESARTELQEKEKSPQFVGSVESVQVGATARMPKRGLEPPPQVTETRT